MVPINYVTQLDDTPRAHAVAAPPVALEPTTKPPQKAWGSPEPQLPTPPSASSKPKVTAATKTSEQLALIEPLPPNYSPAAARARAADTHKRRLNDHTRVQDSGADVAVTINDLISPQPTIRQPKPTVAAPTRAALPARLPPIQSSAVIPPTSTAPTPPVAAAKPEASPPTRRLLPSVPASGGLVAKPTLRPKPAARPSAAAGALTEETLPASSTPGGGTRRPPPPRKPPVLASPSPESSEMLGLPGQILSPPRGKRLLITEL
jgi:hypothetical protein